MVAQVDTMDAFGNGYATTFPEVAKQVQHWAWYDGDYATLWPAATVANGRRLYEAEDQIKLPLFKTVSDFIANAAVSDMPGQSASTAGLLRWLAQNDRMLERAIRRGTRYWSVHNKAVWTAEPGMITAVDPLHYYRVGAPEQPDSLIGHIIAVPWYQRMPDEQPTPLMIRLPNRIKVIKVTQEGSTEQVFRYDGAVVGEPITNLERSTVTAVCTAGDGESWYRGAQDIAARIMISETLLAQEIAMFVNRIRWLPGSVLANIQAARPPGSTPLTLTALKAELDSMVRPVIALGGGDSAPVESMESIDIPGRLAYHDGLYDQFYITAGLPPTSFGIGIGRGESGYAREKAQDAASADIRAYRRDVTECLPLLCRGAGAPKSGNLSFNFATPPFQTRETQMDYALQLLKAGVISQEEVRTLLGWTPGAPAAPAQQQPAPADPAE